MEREKAEREKADRERQDREKAERERAEKERQDRERERAERELQERLQREREQSRHDRERVLHESTDSLAAVDQHFTESLRLASQRVRIRGSRTHILTTEVSKGRRCFI